MKDKSSTLLYITLFILLLMIVFAVVMESTVREKNTYYNIKTVVVQMGKDEGPTRDKFHRPTVYPLILVRSVEDTTLYMQWLTTPEKYYNYNIGDTITFKEVRKYKWFHIKKRGK